MERQNTRLPLFAHRCWADRNVWRFQWFLAHILIRIYCTRLVNYPRHTYLDSNHSGCLLENIILLPPMKSSAFNFFLIFPLPPKIRLDSWIFVDVGFLHKCYPATYLGDPNQVHNFMSLIWYSVHCFFLVCSILLFFIILWVCNEHKPFVVVCFLKCKNSTNNQKTQTIRLKLIQV